MKISSWLRESGVVERNVKDTLESTINALHTSCPLKVSKKSIRASLKDTMVMDKAFSKKSPAHKKIFNWFEKDKTSSSKQPKPSAILEKSRISTPAIANNNRDRSTSPPPVKQKFSLSSSRQAAIAEHFYIFVENELRKFLATNKNIIPANVVETFAKQRKPPISSDFRDADLLSMLNFIVERLDIFINKSVFHGLYKANPLKIFKDFKENVRHKMAHGISTNGEGRWSDLALQNVTYLSCHIVACLGGDCENMYTAREEVDNEIARQLVEIAATKESRPPKRKINDNFCKMTEFVLDVLEEVEETKKGQKQEIMKMALEEDEQINLYGDLTDCSALFTEFKGSCE